MAPNITMAVSCKAWNTPVEYRSSEYKFDIMEPHSEMFSPIFETKIMVQNEWTCKQPRNK